MSIQALPPEVIAQIKSSVTITSLNVVISELIKNALDAGATKIDGTIDYARGGCIVEDDGLGIHPSDFAESGGLGKLYHSSKLNCQSAIHGSRGTFLASLSAMALTSITSHHHSHRSHNTISMHKSEVVSRQVPAPPQQYLQNSSHGTRVIVRDLFGNMPVRVRQRAIVAERQGGSGKEWEEVKREIVGLLISWPKHVMVMIRELDSGQKLVIRPPARFDKEVINANDAQRTCSILSQAMFISPGNKSSWVPVAVSTLDLQITGAISLQPSPNKHVQFVSFGVHSLGVVEGQRTIYDEANRLFSNSAFGNEEDLSDIDDIEMARRARDRRFKGDGYTNKELKGEKKSIERWPMFCINIQHLGLSGSKRQPDSEDITHNSSGRLGTIIELVRTMINQFLTVHNFRPRTGRGQTRKRIDGHVSTIAPQSKTVTPTKQTASKHFSTKSSNPQKEAFDQLGTNVRLPSFRRSLSKPESPFGTCSKIKSGTVAKHVKGKGLVTASEIEVALSRPSSAPPIHAKKTLGPAHKTPLVNKSGKLTRKPFDDIPATRPAKPATKQSELPTARPQSTPIVSANDDDDMVQWVNPITKVRSLVNKRTGLTVPAKNEAFHEVSLRRLSMNSSSLVPVMPGTEPMAENPMWISDLLQTWENPIFQLVEPSIPQVLLDGQDQLTQGILHGRHHNCSQIDIDLAFKESSAAVNGRIAKSALKSAEIISQVDRKFILIKVDVTNAKAQSSHDGNDPILVLIDQHAADERIRIESLMQELCSPPTEAPALGVSPIRTTRLTKALIFEVVPREVQLLKVHIPYFANWGIIYEVTSAMPPDTKALYRLSVRSLPPGILEKCKQEPRLLVDLIRTEAWIAQESGKTTQTYAPNNDQSWLRRTQNCPQGIIDMLNSRACRGAIMFNDELSHTQCTKLVSKLADCIFPFQCAHGRPSLVPLVDIDAWKSLATHSDLVSREQGGHFGKSFRQWERSSH